MVKKMPFFRNLSLILEAGARKKSMPKLYLLFLSTYCLLFMYCKGPMIQSEILEGLNQDFAESEFQARTDIKLEFSSDTSDPVFNQGDRLRIRVEASSDWIRIRARSPEQEIEHSPGKTIIYIFREDIPENMPAEEYVSQRIDNILIRLD